VPARVARTVGFAIRTQAACLHQRVGIAPIRFYAAVPRGVHRREVRVGHDHLVPETLEVSGHPLALSARLEEDACRRKSAENRGEPLAARDDATLLDRAVLLGDAQLTLALV
jgi:hypothetical protein